MGGIGSGKTTAGAQEALKMTQMFPGSVGLIGRLTAKALRDTTQKRFLDTLQSIADTNKVKLERIRPVYRDYQGYCEVATSVPGVNSSILFRHLDEPGQFGSLDLDWWWIDECHEPEGDEVPEDVFFMLCARLRGVVGPLRGFITSNSGGKDWIWKWFFSNQKPDGYFGINCPTSENKQFLPPGYIENLEATHPEKWVKRFLESSFDVFEGMIFEEFTEEEFVLPASQIPDRGIIEAGFDFGVGSPTAVVVARVTPDGCVYIIDEFHRPEADISIVSKWIKARHPQAVWSDPSVRNRGPNKKSPRDLYQEEGVILTPAGSNDALLRISTIHQYLNRKKLFFQKGKTEVTVASLLNSQWAPVKHVGDPERPLKKEDHARDALSYLLMSHPLGILLDPIEPGTVIKRATSVKMADGSIGFRHESLDEDIDSDLSKLVLSEEEMERLLMPR